MNNDEVRAIVRVTKQVGPHEFETELFSKTFYEGEGIHKIVDWHVRLSENFFDIGQLRIQRKEGTENG